MAYHLAGQAAPAFVDRGDRIDVHDASDEAAILAARHGFTITNPELQDVLRQGQAKLAAQRALQATSDACQIGRPAEGGAPQRPRRMR